MGNAHKKCQEAKRVRVVQPGEILLQLFIKGAYTRDGERLFTTACNVRMRGNSFKL